MRSNVADLIVCNLIHILLSFYSSCRYLSILDNNINPRSIIKYNSNYEITISAGC